MAQLELDTRTRNALAKAGVVYVKQLVEYAPDYTQIAGIGQTGADAITQALQEFPLPPDEIPLTFKGLIVCAGRALTVQPSGPWKAFDLDATLGPTEDALQLATRLQALVQYDHLVVRIDRASPDVRAFCEKQGVPLICVDLDENQPT